MWYSFVIAFDFGANIMNYKYHLDNQYLTDPVCYGDTELWQIGRLHCNPSSRIKAHIQKKELYELTLVRAGRGVIYTDGVPASVRAGDIYISFPQEIHEIATDRDELLQFDYFSFSTKNAELSADLVELSANNRYIKKRIFRSDSISDMVSMGISEISGKDKYTYRMMSDICEHIIITLIRCFDESRTTREKDGITDAGSLCYQAMSYIDSHLFSMRSLTEISDSLNYNYSYLSNLFGKTMGQRLVDYYRERKLQAAKRMLSEKGRSVTRVAEMLNYSSVYAFSRAFKAEYGISPNQYKKNMGGE